MPWKGHTMKTNYYTVFIRDDDNQWHDEFGGTRTECKEELEFTYWDTKGKDKKIIASDGTLQGLAANYEKLDQPMRNLSTKVTLWKPSQPYSPPRQWYQHLQC